jgi:hypothetical protein
MEGSKSALDDSVIGIRGWETLIHELEAGGWQRLAPSPASGERWVLLREAKA